MKPPTVYVRPDGTRHGELELPQSVIGDYQAGTSAKTLARRHGVSVPTVLAFLDRHEVPRRRGVRPWVRRDLPTEEIVELYEVGCTTTELAEHYGVNHGTINRLLHDAEAAVRRPGPQPASVISDDEHVVLNLDDAARLLKRGDNLDYVAQQLDADTDDLRRALKDAGYKIPGHRDPNDPERVAKREQHRAASAAAAARQRERLAAERREAIQREREKADERKARAAERARLQAAARRYAEIRQGENEFERRERTQLRDWLAEYPDVLIDIPDPWVVHLRELQAKARTVRGWTPQDAPERRASEELSKLLADALANGQTAYSLAKLLGVTSAAINLRVRRHGYAPLYSSQPAAYKG